MIADDLTFNTIEFELAHKDKADSLRRSVARGITTPDDLVIKQQDSVNSKTQVSEKRSLLRIDRTELIDGVPTTVSVYATAVVPSNVAGASVTAVIATFKAAIADAALLTDVVAGLK